MNRIRVKIKGGQLTDNTPDDETYGHTYPRGTICHIVEDLGNGYFKLVSRHDLVQIVHKSDFEIIGVGV